LFQTQVKYERGFDSPIARFKDNEKKHQIWTPEWIIKKQKFTHYMKINKERKVGVEL